MAKPHEVIVLKTMEEQLSVEINKDGWDMSTADNFTHISAEPPFTETEIVDIKTRLITGELSGKGLGRLAGLEIVEVPDDGVTLTLEGKLDTAKVKFGLALTEEVMAMRGLSGAIVKVDGSEATHVIRTKNEAELAGEHVTIIDADEFEEACKDPANRAFIQEARDYGESLKNRKVRLMGATPETAVLRVPSGRLYGISVDHGPDGEEIKVTELGELPTSEKE